MLSIICGRLHPRPPVFRRPDELVDVLDADNQRERKPASALRCGEVLYGLGVVTRIERAAGVV